nr:hypothetical protein [Clostridia bacterium]
MNSNIRHFNISFKTVAIILVLAIFATLIPSGGLIVSYTEEPYSSFLDPDVFDLSDYPDTSEAGEMLQFGRVSEYERLALEKLGKPATVENINPYRRSDVSYQKTELANAFSRDYALNNGNFTRLVFGMPVNYKTSEGIWKNINLTLHEHEGRLETADTPYSLSFASSCETANDLISIGYSDVFLSLSPLNAFAKPLEAQYEQIPHKEDELLTENPCENGTVVYEEAFAKSDVSPAASLEYTVKPYEIKENIVISEGGFFQYSYSFKLSTDALSIETKDGSVVLYDESGKAVFRLSAALMKDAKNDCSDQVFLTLEETEEGYIIAVSADADWINAEGRVFPVKIDPTIEISYSGEDEAFDAVYVDGMVRDSGIAIGCNTKTYIKFDPDMLSGLPSGATVTHASFAASFYSMQLLPDDIYVRSEKISGSWSPTSVLIGYSAPSVAASYSDLTDSANVNVSGTLPVYAAFELDITPVIYDCFSIGDNGLVLSTDCLSSMPSGHYTVAMTALQITYTDNSGINGYQSSHTVSIDGSGTAYIKDINGDVTFIHPVISTKGEILPVDIDMVYNASFIGTATDTYYGNGWRPSIIQTMKEETVTDINSDTYTYYVLTDGTGGKHYYTHSSGNIYVADENPFYEYNAQARSLDYNDGTVAYFNAYGYLEAVENAYGDSYTVFYIGSTPKIDYVLDGCGSEIDFIYTGSLLSAAENPDCPLRGVSFSYTGNNLTAINSSAGERSTFAYNSNGTMSRFGYRKTSADTCDRQYVQFGYTAGLPDVISSVSSVIKYAVNDSGFYNMRDIAYISYGDHTEYGYRYGSLSADAIYTEYIYFDRSGRTTAVFDSLGNASGSEYEGGSLSKMNLLSGETNTVMTDGNLVKDFSEKTSDWTAYSVTGNGSLYDEYSSSHFGLGRYGGNYFKLTSDSQTSEVYAKYPVPSAVPGKTYTLAVDIDPSDLSGSGGVVLGA